MRQRYVIYEVWTCARIVEAGNEEDALESNMPSAPSDGLILANWHAVAIDGIHQTPALRVVGADERK